MTRQIRFNAFDMNCVAHQSPGLWPNPRDRSWQYKDVEYWAELAATLERGIFDGIFIADVIGYYDVYKGSNYHAIQKAAQIPVNDPLQLAVPISMVTKHLGIFIADVIGYYDVYKGSNYHAIQKAAQIPVNDPLQLAVPISMVTKHLG